MTTKANFWGRQILDLRRQQGISERRLAAAARVPRDTLRRIQAGKSECAIETIERLVDCLGYELEALPKQTSIKRPLADIYPNGRSPVAAARLLSLSPDDL
jgi:transcriptional regulator with XRE-family HTH domain